MDNQNEQLDKPTLLDKYYERLETPQQYLDTPLPLNPDLYAAAEQAIHTAQLVRSRLRKSVKRG